MLQSVSRPFDDRSESPSREFNSVSCRAVGATWRCREHDVLGRDARAERPSTVMRMARFFSGRSTESSAHAPLGGADAKGVSAKRAVRRVWLSPQTTADGSVRPVRGRHNARYLPGSSSPNSLTPWCAVFSSTGAPSARARDGESRREPRVAHNGPPRRRSARLGDFDARSASLPKA